MEDQQEKSPPEPEVVTGPRPFKCVTCGSVTNHVQNPSTGLWFCEACGHGPIGVPRNSEPCDRVKKLAGVTIRLSGPWSDDQFDMLIADMKEIGQAVGAEGLGLEVQFVFKKPKPGMAPSGSGLILPPSMRG